MPLTIYNVVIIMLSFTIHVEKMVERYTLIALSRFRDTLRDAVRKDNSLGTVHVLAIIAVC